MSLPSVTPPRSVAILRFSAAGDVLLTSQAIDALHAALPEAKLVLVTHARYRALLAGSPALAGICALPQGGSLRQFAQRLRREWQIDSVLDLHGSWRSLALTALLRPRRHARWLKRSWKAWAQVKLAQAPYRPEQPMAVRLHAAVEQLVGATVLPAPLVLHVPAGAAGSLGPADAPLVGLSPGAGWATKRWPVQRFAELARRLQARGRQVVLFGSAAEQPLTRQIAACAPGCIDLTGQLDWPATMATARQLDAFVAGDTGPMHMARGLGVPVVVLFTSTPAAQFDLRGHAVLQASAPCSPCSFYGRSACPRSHAACLQDIGIDAVEAALEGLLRRRPTAAKPG